MAVTINVPSQVRTFANLAAFPASGAVKTIYIAEDTNKTYRWTGSVYVEISASAAGGATWGAITGTLSSQTDLQNALNAKQATLVSGTNIKTIEGQSLLGSGDINLTATDVGLGNVDNTSDANKPVSTATQTALNAKQDTLVSATNIKTINGSSVLGSGDLSVGTFVGVHALVPLQSGDSVSAVVNGNAGAGVATTINRLTTFPFIPNQSFTTASFSINVIALLAGANARILIYSNLNGKPDQKLYESANLDCSTTGIKTATTAFNFVAGVTYWLTTHFSATGVNITGHVATSLMSIKNLNTTLAASSYTLTTTFGSAPTTFGTPSPATTTAPAVFITLA